MSLREVVRRSRRTLNLGKERAARLSAAFSLNNLHSVAPAQRTDKGWTVLHLAAMHSKPQTLRLLLKQGCKVTDKDNEGNSALHLAAEIGNREAVRVLLHSGAKLNDRNNEGFSALHLAAKSGREAVVLLFLQQPDINVDMKTTTGNRTALHLAAAAGRVDIVNALIEAGASTRAKASLGWTALHFSGREGRLDVSRLLLHRGARIDAVTTGSWTPLMFAVSHNQRSVAKFLVSKGADTNIVNRDGLTAEAIAAGKGLDSMVAILRGQHPESSSSEEDEEEESRTPSRPYPSPQRELAGVHREITTMHEVHGEGDVRIPEDIENIDTELEDLTADEQETLTHLHSQLNSKVGELNRVREENLKILTDKEKRIRSLEQRLTNAREVENNLRTELETAKKEVRELTVEEAVAKNAFEKSARVGNEKLASIQNEIGAVRKSLVNLRSSARQRLQQAQARHNSSSRNNLSKSIQSLNIEAEIECPICFEPSRPPIYQCPEGHIICNLCRPRVTRCPVCRFEFKGVPDIRNRYVERLALSYFEQEDELL